MLSKTRKLISSSLKLYKFGCQTSQTSQIVQAPAFALLNNVSYSFKSFSSLNNVKFNFEKDQSDQEEVNSSAEGTEETTTTTQVNSLENFDISPEGIAQLKSIGITSLFPIQAATYDYIFQGRDIIARDATGSGKTLSYSLPITERLRKEGKLNNKHGQQPFALVVLPTRELAIQVTNVVNSIKLEKDEFRVLTVYGGTDIRNQIDEARRGVEVLIGTPGRLIDLIERNAISLSKLETIVLDEADHMLDMGFQEDIEKIYEKIRDQVGEKSVQTMLHSATIPSWVHDVSKKYLREDLIKVDLLKNKQRKTPTTVQHLAINCPFSQRIDALADIVLCYGGKHARTIIFTETKKEANDIMMKANIRQECQVLHGDIPQQQREVTFQAFREGKFKCLIATNVAARGLDIPEVDLIVQMEPPTNVDTYIHRAGRTARAGKSGVCMTFFSKKESGDLENIEKKASFKFQKVGIPQPADIIKASSRDIAASIKHVPHEVVGLFKEISQELVNELGPEEALSRALAIISGTTEKFKQRSLLTSREGFITYEIYANKKVRSSSYIRGLFAENFSQELAESIKDIKNIQDGKGAVFDLPEQFEEEVIAFMEKNPECDFFLKKTETLPELEEGYSRDSPYRSSSSNNRRSSFEGYNSRSSSSSFKSDDDVKVFVGSLADSVREDDLEEFFQREGLRARRVKLLKGI